MGPLEVAVSVTPLHLGQHFDKCPACIDTQKVHINYIKFQSRFRWFLHLKPEILNENLLFMEKRVVDDVLICSEQSIAPFYIL
jgi:hypothetical protein